MTQTRVRLIFFLALAALLAIFAGCKSESPTAPPSGGGTGGAGNPGGGITPPVGATIVLVASNATPLVDSVSTITATVTLNGQPVVNGTAVQFVTNLGTFTDTQDVKTIRTTTNGVATAAVTSPDAGVATISATVNNVTKSISITFGVPTTTPPPVSTAPTITSVTPSTGPPAGGTVVTITGTNYRQPIRVLFDAGPAGVKEAFVQPGSTSTQIIAVTPSINLISTQSQAAAVTVIDEAGTPAEVRVTRAAAFTYVTTNLTPVIRAISPTSGPIDGGTRVTIIGDAFDAGGGVQVFFGAAQASVISINFSQIIVTSPTARDTASNGSGAVTGPVDVRVKNIASGKEVTATGGFRYIPKAQVTLLGPNVGPSTGGTRFQVDGTGFNEPLTVTLAGVAAQIIKVTGTQIIGISSPAPITTCSNLTGPTIVANGDNGDTAQGPDWTYLVVKPLIVNIATPADLGSTTTIDVLNLTGAPRVTIGTTTATILGSSLNAATNVTTLTIRVPSSLKLDTAACPGTPTVLAPQPTAFDVTVVSTDTTCSDKAANGLTVRPTAPLLAVFPAAGFAPFTASAAFVGPPATPAKPAIPQTIFVVNGGAGTLMVTAVTSSGAGCANFSVSTATIPASLAQCDPFPITATYTRTAPSGATDQCTLAVTTTGGNRTFILSGSVQ